MFSLRFSGGNFLINVPQKFRVRKIFRTQVFAGFAVFSLRFENYISVNFISVNSMFDELKQVKYKF